MKLCPQRIEGCFWVVEELNSHMPKSVVEGLENGEWN